MANKISDFEHMLRVRASNSVLARVAVDLAKRAHNVSETPNWFCGSCGTENKRRVRKEKVVDEKSIPLTGLINFFNKLHIGSGTSRHTPTT